MSGRWIFRLKNCLLRFYSVWDLERSALARYMLNIVHALTSSRITLREKLIQICGTSLILSKRKTAISPKGKHSAACTLSTHVVSMPAYELLCKASGRFCLFLDVASQLSSPEHVVNSVGRLSDTCTVRQGHMCICRMTMTVLQRFPIWMGYQWSIGWSLHARLLLHHSA